MIITEMSAGAGIERRKSMLGAVARRPKDHSPSRRPRSTPSVLAMRRPSTNSSTLGTRSLPTRAKSQFARNDSQISLSGGKKADPPSRVSVHHNTTSVTGSQTSRPSTEARSRRVALRLTRSPGSATGASAGRGARCA
jgi:hypothetical protein